MIDQKLEHQINIDSERKISTNDQVITKKSSQTSNYLNLMRISHIEELQQVRQIFINKLKTKRMISGPQWHFDQLSFAVVSNTPNYQCLILKVCYNMFNFFITLIFVEETSPIHQIHTRFDGNFSTIYRAQIIGKQTAIKCTCYKNQTFSKVFQSSLSEYVIFLIASQLQIGPKIYRNLAFDLIIYQNCIQFCMEYCQQNSYKISQQGNSQELIYLLKILHSMNIIHGDIKPQNICYSKWFKKYVFIDYGLSRIIKEPFGTQTLTFFRGSVNFCCEEMKSCFENNDERYVDLYFNDAYCLIETLLQMKKYRLCIAEDDRGMDMIADTTKQIIILIYKNANFVQFLLLNNFNQITQFKQILYNLSLSNNINQQAQHFERVMKNKFLLKGSKIKSNNKTSIFLKAHNQLQYSLSQRQYYLDSNRQDFFQKNRNIINYQSQNQMKKGIFLLNGKIDFDQIQRLTNKINCQQICQQIYFYLLSKYLNVFNHRTQQSYKQRISLIFNSLYLKVESFCNLQMIEKMNICYLYLLNYALNRNCLANLEFQIIKNCLISITFLQTPSSKEYLVILKKIIQVQGTLLRKIRMYVSLFFSIRLIDQRLTSKYSYYFFIDFAYGNCKQYISSLNILSLNKQQKQIMEYLKNILENNLGIQFLNIIEQKIYYKMYLIHAMVNDYQLVLMQMHLYVSIVLYLQKVLYIKKELYDILHANLKSQTSHQSFFNYQQFRLIYDITQFKTLKKISQQYKLQLQSFEMFLRQEIANDYFRKKFIQQHKKKYTQGKMLNIDQSSTNIHHLFRILTLEMSRVNLLNQGNITQNILSLLQKFSFQKCLMAMDEPLTHFHDHNFLDQLKSFLTYFRFITLGIDLFNECTNYWFDRLYKQIMKQYCYFCKFYCLIHLNICMPIKNGCLHEQIEWNAVSIISYLVKTQKQISVISEVIMNYLLLIRQSQQFLQNRQIFKCNYISLIFQITKIYEFDFLIYFKEFSCRQSNKVLASILHQTMLQFWKEDHQLYFNFIDELFKYVNSKYKNELQGLEVIFQTNTFLASLANQGVQQLAIFVRQNIEYYKPKLKREINEGLAAHIVLIIDKKPAGIKISPILFIYAWQFGQGIVPKASKFIYMIYLTKYIIEENVVISQRRYKFIWKKCFKSQNNTNQERIMLQTHPGVKLDKRWGKSPKMHRLLFNKKINKYRSTDVRARK